MDLLIVDSVTGTILNLAGCYLVNPDHLLDEEEYSDSEVAEIAEEHGTPISTIVEAYRPDLIPSNPSELV